MNFDILCILDSEKSGFDLKNLIMKRMHSVVYLLLVYLTFYYLASGKTLIIKLILEFYSFKTGPVIAICNCYG